MIQDSVISRPRRRTSARPIPRRRTRRARSAATRCDRIATKHDVVDAEDDLHRRQADQAISPSVVRSRGSRTPPDASSARACSPPRRFFDGARDHRADAPVLHGEQAGDGAARRRRHLVLQRRGVHPRLEHHARGALEHLRGDLMAASRRSPIRTPPSASASSMMYANAGPLPFRLVTASMSLSSISRQRPRCGRSPSPSSACASVTLAPRAMTVIPSPMRQGRVRHGADDGALGSQPDSCSRRTPAAMLTTSLPARMPRHLRGAQQRPDLVRLHADQHDVAGPAGLGVVAGGRGCRASRAGPRPPRRAGRWRRSAPA